MRSLLPALLLAIPVAPLPAQSAPSVVGTWRLVSMGRTDSTGRFVPSWDDHPAGRITYTADGHMAAQLYDTRRAPLGANVAAADSAAVRAAFLGLITYFGRYTIDAADHLVRHKVEGASRPDWVSGTLVRSYRFLTPDRLELTVVTDYAGHRVTGSPTVLAWERIGH